MSSSDKATVADKMTQLEELVAWFDSDEFTLEKAIDRFNDADELASQIDQQLNELSNQITVLKQKFDQ